MSTSVRCSDTRAEPLPGTAKQERIYVVLEYPHGWSRDILDGDTFGEELSAALKAHLGDRAGLQLIQSPGRAGRHEEPRQLFLVFAEEGIIERLTVTGPEAILKLDLTGPGRNAAEVVDHPLVLICTHGKRDACCALKGRPMAAALAQQYPGHEIWETSHTKGHRFAPSVLVMPWGYSFGRMDDDEAAALVAAAREGSYFLPGNRGRGLHGPAGQVAELAVAKQLIDAGEDLRFAELTVGEGGVVAHADGRRWVVELARREFPGVVSSCGDAPKVGTGWEAVAVTVA